MQNKRPSLFGKATKLFIAVALASIVFGISNVGAVEVYSESVSPYSPSSDFTFRGTIGTEYDGSGAIVNTQSFITVDFPQNSAISYEMAGNAAYYMLKYAQHYPGCQEFLENWNLEELTDEIYARMNTPYGAYSVTISSEQSDREEIVYGTFPNPIQFYYDDSGAVKYFISADNDPEGSIVLQDCNSEYFAENGYGQAREDVIQYGLDHNTPISEERTSKEMKREMRVHNDISDQAKDPNSVLYFLLQQKGMDPVKIEFRAAEMNIDKQPETFPGASFVPIEWQEQLGLTSNEAQVLGGILNEVD